MNFLQTQDPTICGQIYAHLTNTPFIHNNIGFFLAGTDTFAICMNPQDEYFVMLRTETSPPPREGIFKNASSEVQYIQGDIRDRNELKKLDQKYAITEIVHATVITANSPGVEEHLAQDMTVVIL